MTREVASHAGTRRFPVGLPCEHPDRRCFYSSVHCLLRQNQPSGSAGLSDRARYWPVRTASLPWRDRRHVAARDRDCRENDQHARVPPRSIFEQRWPRWGLLRFLIARNVHRRRQAFRPHPLRNALRCCHSIPRTRHFTTLLQAIPRPHVDLSPSGNIAAHAFAIAPDGIAIRLRAIPSRQNPAIRCGDSRATTNVVCELATFATDMPSAVPRQRQRDHHFDQ